jgi:hypothetical protein
MKTKFKLGIFLFSPPREIFPVIYVQFLHKRPFTDLWVYYSVACKKSMRPNIDYIMLNDTVKVD